MKFWISQSTSDMMIGNAIVNDMDFSDLSSNIKLVFWNDTEGEIEYKNKPGLRERYTDLTPYVPYVDDWMTATAAKSPAITLEQAKLIKCEVIDALFAGKRKSPISYLSNNWDADDEALTAMVQKLSLTTSTLTFSNLITDINTKHSSFVTDVNSKLSGVASTVNSGVGTLVGSINSVLSALVSAINNAENDAFGRIVTYTSTSGEIDFRLSEASASSYSSGTIVPYSYTGSGIGSLTVGSVSSGSGSAGTTTDQSVSVPTTNISWLPTAATSPVSLTFSQFSGLVDAIMTRRTSLASTRNSKKAAVNALTTVTAIIDYDTTAGWP